ncbi:hypothetical protein NEPTK9_000383 [Candidatus Neptunochlamydia vexilliferae]|uniref:Uncharacterized protein n=1 Tax=Candidatus Neptunichlamydia vexilliferae TaxID=1651774 RepID=A0ABS0AXN0_9BACT|nr:hypothetical protein [Candidatus Neptunochlamydia vexilliferae]
MVQAAKFVKRTEKRSSVILQLALKHKEYQTALFFTTTNPSFSTFKKMFHSGIDLLFIEKLDQNKGDKDRKKND